MNLDSLSSTEKRRKKQEQRTTLNLNKSESADVDEQMNYRPLLGQSSWNGRVLCKIIIDLGIKSDRKQRNKLSTFAIGRSGK